jgi:hypothetical protein
VTAPARQVARARSRHVLLLTALTACAWTAAAAGATAQMPASPTTGSSGAQAATPAVPRGPGSLAGIWETTGYKTSRNTARSRVAVTADGKPPPLLPAAATLLEKRLADADRGYPFPITLASCLPGGMPLMVIAGAPYPIQIIESPGQVTMLFEEQNHFRIIALGGKHPEDPDPTFMGHSTGRWEGDTLVVDTVGLSERTTIDQVGTPHSARLHLVERWRRLDGATLEVLVTLTDPETFSRPWQARSVYKIVAPGTVMGEYICENNRNEPDAQGRMGFQR